MCYSCKRQLKQILYFLNLIIKYGHLVQNIKEEQKIHQGVL